MFEWLLVNHCAPTLAGIKSANLFMYSGNDAKQNVLYWNNILNSFGLKLIILSQTNEKSLIYIYRINLLENILNNIDVQIFLKDYGYKDINDINLSLSQLSNRISYPSFPHEIGIFLDYPLEDVKMFILNKGKNYKLSGIWKVYCNEEKSMQIFENYKNCTSLFSNSFLNGEKITDLCVA